MLGEIHNAKKICSNFQKEVENFTEKFGKANFVLRLINSVVAQFNNNTYNDNERNKEDEMIISPQLFEIPKKYLEHNHPNRKSEPSKHLYQNINHVFTWLVICSPPKIDRIQKNLEAFYTALMRPNLNEHCDSNVFILFRNGIA